VVNMRISKSATPRSLAVSIALSYTPGRSCTDSTVLGLDLTQPIREMCAGREKVLRAGNSSQIGMPGECLVQASASWL
jgi:hypothetical protein